MVPGINECTLWMLIGEKMMSVKSHDWSLVHFLVASLELVLLQRVLGLHRERGGSLQVCVFSVLGLVKFEAPAAKWRHTCATLCLPGTLLMCACVCTQSCLTLCDCMDCNPPGSVHGILQARILDWVAMPSSRGSSQPRD